VSSAGGSQLFFDTAGSADKTLKLYEGYVHDLLNDLGKEKVMADIHDLDRCPSAVTSARSDRVSVAGVGVLPREIATLDGLLQEHADVIGHDFVAYRNRAYRVANLCLALAPDHADRIEKIAVAAAFHDLGMPMMRL